MFSLRPFVSITSRVWVQCRVLAELSRGPQVLQQPGWQSLWEHGEESGRGAGRGAGRRRQPQLSGPLTAHTPIVRGQLARLHPAAPVNKHGSWHRPLRVVFHGQWLLDSRFLPAWRPQGDGEIGAVREQKNWQHGGEIWGKSPENAAARLCFRPGSWFNVENGAGFLLVTSLCHKSEVALSSRCNSLAVPRASIRELRFGSVLRACRELPPRRCCSAASAGNLATNSDKLPGKRRWLFLYFFPRQ